MLFQATKAGYYRSESNELRFLLEGLGFLTRAEIVGEIQEEIGTIGKPDFVMNTLKGRIALIAEGKSTHNLLIPNKASILVSKYKKAYKTNTNTTKDPQDKKAIRQKIHTTKDPHDKIIT